MYGVPVKPNDLYKEMRHHFPVTSGAQARIPDLRASSSTTASTSLRETAARNGGRTNNRFISHASNSMQPASRSSSVASAFCGLPVPAVVIRVYLKDVNEEPQPQLPVEFGFLNVNPDPITPGHVIDLDAVQVLRAEHVDKHAHAFFVEHKIAFARLLFNVQAVLKPEHPPGTTRTRSPEVSGRPSSPAINFLISVAADSVTFSVTVGAVVADISFINPLLDLSISLFRLAFILLPFA